MCDGNIGLLVEDDKEQGSQGVDDRLNNVPRVTGTHSGALTELTRCHRTSFRVQRDHNGVMTTSPSAGQPTRRAIVTGASSGIGQETVRQLRDRNWETIAVARRGDRLKDLAHECGCIPFAADLVDEGQVDALARFADEKGAVDALVNCAGGARGIETIADAVVDKWQHMFDINVKTTLQLTRALLPQMRERGGDIVFLTSTAAHDTYPGGGGYVAAKHAERIIANTLRIELVGEPVRIIEIAPGMVKTEEFSLRRLESQEAADSVYEGVAEPLTAADIADAIVWTLTRPSHVNIDSMIIRPRAQASNTLVARETDGSN